LEQRLDASFDAAVDLLLHAATRGKKIVVIGIGKSGHVAEKISATLTSTGSLSVVLHSVNATHGDLGVVSDGDAILILSASGETEEIVALLPALRRFEVEIVAITGNPQSLLAKSGTVHIDASVEQEACPLQLAPTSSTTVMLALGDALAMVLLEARGFTSDDFAKFHPGGNLGRRLLLRVTDIMRGRDRLALVPRSAAIRQVLNEMRARRSGAAVVIEADGKLAGIFTHGDFARHFESDPHLGDHPVERYMTVAPITINADQLAVAVLQILENSSIDDLIVLDGEQHPIGIVDSQDLAKFKLL
ncbi:MAG TPA: KpsF/GutQ family sugar-phosphate isomerase, partial [Chthoniobacterales bacterium]